MDFGGIFGGIASLIGGAMNARAQRKAMEAQLAALKEQREFVYNELDPNKINTQATDADIAQAQNRLKLQKQIDPQLLQSRYDAETKIAQGLGQLGSEQDVADLAKSEAMAGTPGMATAKKLLVDRAIAQLNAGATLPPDVQAELVKAGLEKSGMVTGAASARGMGGTLIRKLIGSEGIALQKQREEQAQNLLSTAQGLETSRQNILQNLFPNLAKTQLGNLAGAGSVFGLSDASKPNAGLSGSNIADIWLKRVGATGNIMGTEAQTVGSGTLGTGAGWAQGIAGLAQGLAGAGASLVNRYQDPFANPQY